MDITNPLLYGIPAFLIFILIEFLIGHHQGFKLYDKKDFLTNSYLGAGAVFISIFTKTGAFLLYLAIYNSCTVFRETFLGYQNLGWSWWAWLLAILADDFTFYWHHRFSHKVRLLWAAHMVHHSSIHYNLGTSFRTGWIVLFYKPLLWTWMAAVGFHPAMIVTVISLNTIYQFGLHTKLLGSFGFLDNIFNTPEAHQVHHACNLQYLDKNNGGMLIIWDKIFGTYEPYNRSTAIQFGVLKEYESRKDDLKALITQEYKCIWNDFKSAPSLKVKFKYAFFPPGWSHDNTSKTTKQIQKENYNSINRPTTSEVLREECERFSPDFSSGPKR